MWRFVILIASALSGSVRRWGVEAMRIAFELPKADLQDLIRFTGAVTVQEAALTAVREFNRRRSIAKPARPRVQLTAGESL
jgi:hypothetical protein